MAFWRTPYFSGWKSQGRIPSSSRSSPDLNDGELNDQLYLPSSMSMIGVQLASLSQADENLFSHTTFSQKLLARLHPAANNLAPTYGTNELLTMLVMMLTCPGRYSSFCTSRSIVHVNGWSFSQLFAFLSHNSGGLPWDFQRCIR